MLAVLIRYGIGAADKYDRGRWITETDISRIAAGMETDPTKLIVPFNGKKYTFVNGTNQHNQVRLNDFTQLFTE